MKKILLTLLTAVCAVSAWAYTLPTSTMDLKTITAENMGTWVDQVSYELSANWLVVSGYASYKSVGEGKQTWITQSSAGNSASTWNTITDEPFKGSSYYTTASYTTIQSGRNLVYRVKNCNSVKVYGKNNASSKYLKICFYEVTDGVAANNAAYTVSNTSTDEQVWSQALDASKEYVVDIEGVGTSNSRVFEVAFERNVTTEPRINASDVTIESDATSGEIAYSIINPAGGVNPTAAITTGDWISNVAVNTATGKITFDATENSGNTDRSATITISYTGANDKVVTITQKKHIDYINYNKVSASEMVIGGTYVWYAEKSDGTSKSVATPLGSNSYFGAGALANDSKIESNILSLTTESPELFIFNQIGDSTWTIEDADNAGKYLYVSGDKKLAWNTTKNEWTLSGTTQPAFACSTHNSTAYTIYGNLGSTRFCAYTALGSMQNAILYHLASESAHTLSCVIDNETTKTYNIKDGYTWALLTPEKDGYVFLGWATTAEGEVAYADGADYTMPAANATLYAKWRQQTSAPVFTTDLNAAYNCNKGGAAVTLTVEATDADSYQWYKNTTATTAGATAIDGATEASYDYTGTTIGTEYVYCVATNAVGSTTSTIAAVTTKGSNLAVLSRLSFSNGFDAFIKNNTVTAYYMAGTTAPTVNESSIVISEGAIYEIVGNTLTVLAEDGETMVDYTIVLSAVTPNTTAAANEAEFDGTETWIKTGYGWEAAKGWKFSKNTESDGVLRITDGRNRQYWFVGPATEFTLVNTGVTSDRNIKVYVNGVEQTGITKIEKASGNNSISITGLSATNNNMVAIVSNNTGGDGGFTKYTFTPVVPTTQDITITSAGYATYVTQYALDFSESDVTAYAVTPDLENDRVVLTSQTQVPAGKAIVVKGAARTHNIPTIASAADFPTALEFSATATAYDNVNTYYYLGKEGNTVGFRPLAEGGSIAAGKCFFKVAKVGDARFMRIATEGETTGIKTIESAKINAVVYNLAGQRVAANAKGIVIVNGKKMLNK